MLVAWSIRKERNQHIFQKVKLTSIELADLILDEAKLWCYAGLTHLLELFPQLENNVVGSAGVLSFGRDLINV